MANTPTQHPAFVENIVETVKTLLADHHDALVIQRPDYDKPLGTMENLARTTLYLSKADEPKDIAMVHISNIAYGENKDMHVVLFGTMEGGTTHTVNYQPPVSMMTKEHLVSNVGSRSNVEVHNDIVTYLVAGKLPN